MDGVVFQSFLDCNPFTRFIKQLLHLVSALANDRGSMEVLRVTVPTWLGTSDTISALSGTGLLHNLVEALIPKSPSKGWGGIPYPFG